MQDFLQSSRAYIDLFNTWAKELSPAARADHICYKCSSKEEFERLRGLFEADSVFVYQSIISERRIAVIKFSSPLPSLLGDIWYLELSDQKRDGSQVSGFDHIEIYPTSGTMEELALSLEKKGTVFSKTVRPHHTTFDTFIKDNFKVRIEPEALIEKIQRDEMR